MVIVIRHDVDNPVWHSIPLNYVFLRIKNKMLREKKYIPRYLESVKALLHVEKAHGIKATWFFRTCTLPSDDIRNELQYLKHEIAYHSDREDEYDTFLRDLTTLQTSLGPITGVSHHGSTPYCESRLLKYISKAGLRYLGQGVRRDEWVIPHKIGNVWVFGNHITLKDVVATYDYASGERVLLEYIRNKHVAQILLHPSQYMRSQQVRTLFESVITKHPKHCFVTHSEAIDHVSDMFFT